MIEQERYITNMARVWVSIKFRRKINNGYIPKGLWAGKETIVPLSNIFVTVK